MPVISATIESHTVQITRHDYSGGLELDGTQISIIIDAKISGRTAPLKLYFLHESWESKKPDPVIVLTKNAAGALLDARDYINLEYSNVIRQSLGTGKKLKGIDITYEGNEFPNILISDEYKNDSRAIKQIILR